MYPALRINELAGQVNVIHRDLGQRPVAAVTVDVRRLLVHERRPTGQLLRDEGTVIGLVQVVGNSALTQCHRFAGLFVNKVIGIHQFTGLRTEHLKLAAHEHIIHLGDISVERLVGKHGKPKDQVLGLHVNLPGTLVAELAADQAAIAGLLVLVHFLAEAQRARGQGVAVLLTQGLDRLSHLVPVVLATKQPLGSGGTIIEADARVQHAGVDNILTHLLWREHDTGLRLVMEKRHGCLVNLIIAAHPALQPGKVAIRIERLHLGAVVAWETLYGDEGIVAKAFALTNHVNAATMGKLLVVGDAHHATINQLTGRYTQTSSVVLHHTTLL